MSKQLSELDINNIVLEINRMRGKITWNTVEKKIRNKLALPHTSWALRKVPKIEAAYHEKKELTRKEKNEIKKAKSANATPKNAEEIIADLEFKNNLLMERIEIILKNAVKLGVPVEEMEMPVTPISYKINERS